MLLFSFINIQPHTINVIFINDLFCFGCSRNDFYLKENEKRNNKKTEKLNQRNDLDGIQIITKQEIVKA